MASRMLADALKSFSGDLREVPLTIGVGTSRAANTLLNMMFGNIQCVVRPSVCLFLSARFLREPRDEHVTLSVSHMFDELFAMRRRREAFHLACLHQRAPAGQALRPLQLRKQSGLNAQSLQLHTVQETPPSLQRNNTAPATLSLEEVACTQVVRVRPQSASEGSQQDAASLAGLATPQAVSALDKLQRRYS